MLKMNLKKGRLVVLIFCSIGLAFLSSCKESGVNTSNQNASVSLKAQNSGSQDNTVMIIESAKVLLEKVELQNSNDLVTINYGPFVVSINLLGTLNEIALAVVPPGTYDRVNFKIHKHNPNEPILDPDFGTSGVGYSAVIAGTYNGESFVYKSPKTAIQHVVIDPPIFIPEGIEFPVNVTLVVDPARWFVKNGEILDPRNPANENDIDNNIKDSFLKAFKDNDKNGVADS
jgi:hypothetical protein